MHMHMKKSAQRLYTKIESIGQWELLIVMVMVTVFLGQLYYKPFYSEFRFSLSVTALSLLLFYFNKISCFFIACLVGFSTVIFRGACLWLVEGTFSAIESVSVLFFYIVYGIIFSLLQIKEKERQFLYVFFALWVCDTLSNVAELVARQGIMAANLDSVAPVLVIAGLIRSALSVFIYALVGLLVTRAARKQEKKQYYQMLVFFSTLKDDLFFFRKLMENLETTMQDSYSLYEQLEDGKRKELALQVARSIHEIKKDYMRISTSMEGILSEEYRDASLRTSAVFAALEQNFNRYQLFDKEPVEMRFHYHQNLLLSDYSAVVSILNNLITNSLEAIKDGGISPAWLHVEQENQGSFCVLSVADNGPGIAPENLEYIFDPGFSTKFDKQTGQLSNGLGLVQIRYLAEQMGGRVEVSSRPGETTFRVYLPLAAITRPANADIQGNEAVEDATPFLSAGR